MPFRAARARCPSDPAGFCRFCALMAALMSVAVNPELGHLVGIHPHAHRIHQRRAEPRIADARQAADLVQQIDLRVVGQEHRIIAVVRRNQSHHHQERARYFLHRHALALHFRRQPRQREIHFVLRLHRGGIGIGSQLERHRDRHRSVVGAVRQEVQHAVEARPVVLRSAARRFSRDRSSCRPGSSP